MTKVVRLFLGSDLATFYWLNRTLRMRLLDLVIPLVTHLGGAFTSVVLCVSLLWIPVRELHSIGIHLVVSLIASHLIVMICKRTFPRIRPHLALEHVTTAGNILHDASFPSGHSTAAFCMAVNIAPLVSNGAEWFYFMAAIVAYSRVYLGMHYPSDVVIGCGLGIITSLIVGDLFY